MMFGDVGHGILLLILSIYLMVYDYNPAKPQSLDGAYKARHLLLLMAIFAIFCGSMYNDYFGL